MCALGPWSVSIFAKWFYESRLFVSALYIGFFFPSFFCVCLACDKTCNRCGIIVNIPLTPFQLVDWHERVVCDKYLIKIDCPHSFISVILCFGLASFCNLVLVMHPFGGFFFIWFILKPVHEKSCSCNEQIPVYQLSIIIYSVLFISLACSLPCKSNMVILYVFISLIFMGNRRLDVIETQMKS